MDQLQGSRTIIYGPSRSGKTHLLIDILKKLKKARKVDTVLISPTAKRDPIWKKRGNGNLINTYFESPQGRAEGFIKKLIRKTDLRRSKKGMTLVILDDLGEDTFISRGRKENVYRQLYIAAFQSGLHFITLNQSLTQVPPILRKNAEFIYCKRIRDIEERKTFAKEFLGTLEPEIRDDVLTFAWQEPFDTLCIVRTNPNEEKFFRNFKEKIRTLSDQSFNSAK